MGKLNYTASSLKFTKAVDNVQRIKRSKLSKEEKEIALKAYSKMVLTTIVVVLLSTILFGVFTFSVIDTNLEYLIIGMVLWVIFLVGYAFFARFLFKDLGKALQKIELGFDGLSEEEIEKLKPDSIDQVLIKNYKRKDLFINLFFLSGLVFIIFIGASTNLYSRFPKAFIVFIVLYIVFWYFKQDGSRAELFRLMSGFYKRSVSYKCMNCNKKVEKSFTVLSNSVNTYETYNKCPYCGKEISFFNNDLKAIKIT